MENNNSNPNLTKPRREKKNNFDRGYTIKDIREKNNPITELLGDPELRLAYYQQWLNARRRGIDFLLSYQEWLMIWLASGKLDERGKGKGKYCMSRFNDRGAYTVGNVEIKLNTDNNREGSARWLRTPAHKRKLARVLDAVRAHTPCTIAGETFDSYNEAARALGVCDVTVKNRCKSMNPKWLYWVSNDSPDEKKYKKQSDDEFREMMLSFKAKRKEDNQETKH